MESAENLGHIETRQMSKRLYFIADISWPFPLDVFFECFFANLGILIQ